MFLSYIAHVYCVCTTHRMGFTGLSHSIRISLAGTRPIPSSMNFWKCYQRRRKNNQSTNNH